MLLFSRTAALALALACTAQAAPPLSPAAWQQHVRQLASPAMGGRATGSAGLEKAARYIEKQFARAGVLPVPGHSYRQFFPVTRRAEPGPSNEAGVWQGGVRTPLRPNIDVGWHPLSGSGRVRAPVVFAGYGITAPECGYDDYANLDVRGRYVLVLRHEPQEFDARSVFAGRSYTGHAQVDTKVRNAERHGAVGVLLVQDVANHGTEQAPGPDRFEPPATGLSPAGAAVPVLQISADLAATWLRATGVPLAERLARIDRTAAPQSAALGADLEVDARLEMRREAITAPNLIAYVPGATSEHVIVGAHYDHLGRGEQFSLSPQRSGEVHPGADDNASGVAALLELARHVAQRPRARRGLLLIAFAGEEVGLLGSQHYADHPWLPVGDAVAMINLDMIGRMRDTTLHIGNVRSGTGLREMLEDVAGPLGVRLDDSDTAEYGSSDHASFMERQVPSVFFFTGLHEDYHRPTDTWERVDAAASATVLRVVTGLVERLQRAAVRPQYVAPFRATPTSPAPVPSARRESGWTGQLGWVGRPEARPTRIAFRNLRSPSIREAVP